MNKWLLTLLVPVLAVAAGKPPLSVRMDEPASLILPTMTFRAYPQKGAAPLTSKLTWTSTAAKGCVAAGAFTEFTGAKATSGTETITVTHGGKIVLTCYGATPGAIVSWTIPTQNTDGSPLTNLGGFFLFVSTDSGAVATASPIKIANPTATTYTVTDLPAGMNYFAMQSYNTNDAVSSMTGTVNSDVPAQAVAIQRWITITQPPPPPPTDISVTQEGVPPPPPPPTHEHP